MTTSPIYVPSKGRAGKSPLIAEWWGQGVSVVVEPQEEGAYRAAYPNATLVVLPQDNGGITFVRQFILQRMRDWGTGGWFWMLDDDIKAFYRVVNKRCVKTPMPEVLAAAEAQFATDSLIAQGALEYQQFAWSAARPLKLNGYCDVAVILNVDRTKTANYCQEVAGKEDRDFTIQLLANGWRTARATHCAFAAPKNGSNPGGLSDWYADRDRELAVTERMIAKWGRDICQLKVKPDGRPDCGINWRHFKP